MSETGNHPLVPDYYRDDRSAAWPGAGGEVSPYASFDLPRPDLEPVGQVDALMADPEIAGYLRGNGPGAWNGRRFRNALLGFFVTALVLGAVFFLTPGNLFRSYAPPPPQNTPKPQPYPEVAGLPILFRDSIRDINAEIADGNRWQGAFTKLRDFLAESENGKLDAPADLLLWARQEMLVILASKEIPPNSYPDAYPDEVFQAMTELREKTGGLSSPFPFRAGSAYARILSSRPLPRDKTGAQKHNERLTNLMESIRAAHPNILDNNRELLAIEAEAHIRQFPRRYSPGDQFLDYHWRRSAHDILRLYELAGKNDPGVRQIDRRRWQAAYRFFDMTLFTWDPKRIGRIKTARLDGVDYTREQIRKELEKL